MTIPIWLFVLLMIVSTICGMMITLSIVSLVIKSILRDDECDNKKLGNN